MSIARKFKRKQQIDEIKHSYCRKCGNRLYVKKGKAICKKCGVDFGKASNRV